MSGTLLVGAEGVILVPRKDKQIGSARVIMDGVQLVRQLTPYRLVVMANTQDAEAIKYFCRFNGLPRVNVITMVPEDEGLEPYLIQWHMIQRQRGRGNVDLVLTGYARTYQECVTTRQAVLLYGRTGSVGERPAQPSWDDLAQTSVARREALIEQEVE